MKLEMDSNVKKSCFEEISYLILDENKQVDVKLVSNNWDVSLKEASKLIEEWLEVYGENKNFSKKYLVKAIDANQNGIVTIVPEQRLKTLEKKTKKISYFLYSIELLSESSKDLIIPIYTTCNKINLKIHLEERNNLENVESNEVNDIVPEKLTEEKKKVTPKSEPEVNKITSEIMSVEKLTPKKEKKTPKKNNSPGKKSIKKEIPKKSIASFFSSTVSKKPNKEISPKDDTKCSVSPPIKVESISPKLDTSKKSSPKSPKIINKTQGKKESATEKLKQSLAMINDDDSSNSNDEIVLPTPKSKTTTSRKRASTTKKKNEKSSKRARIMVQSDSSSEDDEEKMSIDDEVKKEVIESPIKNGNNNQTKETNSNKKRYKAKRVVSKTYEDKDGFITTVKEIEEYSCSDEDVTVENEKESPKVDEKENLKVKVTPPMKNTKSNIKPATKQGSIMSFFSKK